LMSAMHPQSVPRRRTQEKRRQAFKATGLSTTNVDGLGILESGQPEKTGSQNHRSQSVTGLALI